MWKGEQALQRRPFAGALLFARLAPPVLDGSAAAYSKDLATHSLSRARSAISASGKTTYSFIGRPGIGSNTLAPCCLSRLPRRSSGSRTSMLS